MTKKVLLAYPGKYGQFKPLLPLQYLYLSSALLENGYECQILDMRIDDFRRCNLDDTICVGITSMTGPMLGHAIEFARFVRQTSPKTPIVWGGLHASMVPEQTAESKYVDIVVRGEGEITLLELVDALEKDRPLNAVKGLTFKDNGSVVNTPDRDFIDLNDIPVKLPYHLLDTNRYNIFDFPIHTSRGCPHGCTFCYNLIFNRRSFRYKTAERVLDEIEYILKTFPVTNLDINWEDNFFVNQERVQRICEGIIERGLNFQWHSFCRVDYASKFDESFLKLVETSGCWLLSYGGESGSQEILNSVVNKGITIQQVLETTRKMSKTKMIQQISFMCGFPGETYEDFSATCNLIDEITKINPGAEIVGLFPYTPYPGAPLIEVVKEKYNFQPPQTLEEWQGYRIFRAFGNTWVDKRFANVLRGLTLMTRFNFYRDKPRIPQPYQGFPYWIVYRVCCFLAKLRWRRRFFRFPVEWWLLEKVMERWRGWV